MVVCCEDFAAAVSLVLYPRKRTGDGARQAVLTRYNGNGSGNPGERQHLQKQIKRLKMSVVFLVIGTSLTGSKNTRVLV
jgi:hypothetical protein